MEFLCSRCGKRLRVSDQHANPKVRCPNCRHVFRPFEQQTQPRPPRQESADSALELATRRDAGPATADRPLPRRPDASKGFPFSQLAGIFFMLLLVFGPRLAKVWMREDRKPPPPPPPVKKKVDRRAFDEFLERNLKNAEEDLQRRKEIREKNAKKKPRERD